MFVGGVGLCETMHVRLIVEPESTNISGMPIIVVIGSVKKNGENLENFHLALAAQVISIKSSLTDDRKHHGNAKWLCSTHLALKNSRVSFLNVENLFSGR